MRELEESTMAEAYKNCGGSEMLTAVLKKVQEHGLDPMCPFVLDLMDMTEAHSQRSSEVQGMLKLFT